MGKALPQIKGCRFNVDCRTVNDLESPNRECLLLPDIHTLEVINAFADLTPPKKHEPYCQINFSRQEKSRFQPEHDHSCTQSDSAVNHNCL